MRAKRICEVGVYAGSFLKALAHCGPDLIVGVDRWLSKGTPGQTGMLTTQVQLDRFYLKLHQWAMDQVFDVKLIKGLSLEAVTQFDCEFDCIYIDADHTYEAVSADLAAWWPKLKPGGIFGGHDYFEHINRQGAPFGLIRAVNEFMEAKGLQLWVRRKSWFTIKTEDRCVGS